MTDRRDARHSSSKRSGPESSSASRDRVEAAPRMKRTSVICLLGGAALVAVVLALGPYFALSKLSVASGGMLDEAPRSTVAAVRTHFESIGAEGRQLYRSHFFFDLVFLAGNALVLFALLRLALTRRVMQQPIRRRPELADRLASHR